MKMAGVPQTDPALARAREWVLERGGPTQANVFTKITLALFGQYPWGGVPAMPVEIMLLPRWSYFNVWEISYWSRTVLIPLLIVMDRRPRPPRPPRRGHRRAVGAPPPSRRSGVRPPRARLVEEHLHRRRRLPQDVGGFGPRPWRGRAIRAAHDWLVPRMSAPGGLGGIYPAMVNGILAMRLLGYPDDHRLITGQLKEIEALGIEEPRRFHVQPCVSPVWDTALALNALLASGLPRRHPALLRASDWLMDRQVTEPGDWQIKRPGLPPGGWAFQFDNPFYPDLDDTAVVAMGLHQVDHPDDDRRRAAIERAVRVAPGHAGQGRRAGPRSTRTRRGSSSTTSPSPTTGRSSTRPPRTSPPAASSASRGSARPRDDPAIQRGRRVPPPDPDVRGRVARPLGRELPLRHLVGPPRARGDRARCRRPDGQAGDPLARGPPESGRGLGRDLRLLRRPAPEGPRRVGAQPDGLGRSSA